MVDLALTFKGYRVVTARNGQEALDAIKKEHPALIITDILMSRMDGFSLVHRLRINPKTRGIPVVFLSATYVAPEDKQFAAAIGVTRFIEKPIVLEELLRTVSDLLSRGTLADSKPLDTRKFYDGYRMRLETKLKQKVTQISRTESMLDTLTEEEKETKLKQKVTQISRTESMLDTLTEEEKQSFRASLQATIEERDEIQLLLDQIRKVLDEEKNPR